MSYDINAVTKRCETCHNPGGHVIRDWNCTYNVSGIVERCFQLAHFPQWIAETDGRVSWPRLNGMPAEQAVTVLRAAWSVATGDPWQKELKAMEPANKWGTLEGVARLFEEMAEFLSEEGQHCVIEVK